MNRCLVISFIIFNLCALSYLYKCWLQYNRFNEKIKQEPFEKIFIPSDKWQTIPKDQSLPRGMHVRINLATGEREAKILEQSKSKDNNELAVSSLSNVEEIKNVDSNEDALKIDYIKEALKNIKNDLSSISLQGSAENKRKFRTYDQLKEELSALEVDIKTDAEVLDELLGKFKDLLKSNSIMKVEEENMLVAALMDLEYLLHQIDNAKLFVKYNGMSEVIIPCLGSNSTRIRQITARVIGSAVQNNAVVQIAALEAGVIPYLVRTIALEKSDEVRSSSLYALSCLIRSFPHAQLKFVESGGLSVFISLFDEHLPNSKKLQLKAISFLSDLLQEKLDAEQSVREQRQQFELDGDVRKLRENKFDAINERLKQYKLVDLGDKLVQRGWCRRLGYFLLDNCYRHYSAKDGLLRQATAQQTGDAVGRNLEDEETEDAMVEHDVVDRTVNALLPLSETCKPELIKLPYFNEILLNLNGYYANLSAKEPDDSYFHGIYKVIGELSRNMGVLQNA